MILLAAFALSGCLALSPASDHIRAQDLATAIPAWSAVDPEIDLLPAPIPGVQRIIHADELRRLAVRWKVEAANLPVLPDLCFAIPVALPDPARMLAAMQRGQEQMRKSQEQMRKSREAVADVIRTGNHLAKAVRPTLPKPTVHVPSLSSWLPVPVWSPASVRLPAPS